MDAILDSGKWLSRIHTCFSTHLTVYPFSPLPRHNLLLPPGSTASLCSNFPITKAKPPRINTELFFYYKSRWRLNAANRTGFVYIMFFHLGCSPCMSPALVTSTYGCSHITFAATEFEELYWWPKSSQDQIVFVKSNLKCNWLLQGDLLHATFPRLWAEITAGLPLPVV